MRMIRPDKRVILLLLVCFGALLLVQQVLTVFKGEFPLKQLSHQLWRTDEVPLKKSGFPPEDTIESRRHRVQEVCTRLGTGSGEMSEVTGYKPANLSYCVVQKAGCTIWIRIFKFLSGQNSDTGSPMTISKYNVHYVKMNLYHLFKAKGPDKHFVETSLRAMTVRNPYTRLWSAYIDKFILPDFWQTKGKEIIKKIRKNPERKSLVCGHDVSFSEFLQYVAATGRSFKSWNQDKHWLPESDLCDPCVFKPHIVAKQETFLRDVNVTLQKAGLEHMLDAIMSTDPVEFEIADEIDYNFHILKKYAKCVSAVELGERIWRAFILNGYFPVDSSFPTIVDPKSFNQKFFTDLVLSERQKNNVTKSYTKLSRLHALHSAYSNIDIGLKQKLRDLFKRDFEMFGYDLDSDYF